YELFDWQYAQAEKDIMNLEKEIKSLDNTDCLLSDRSKTSIGRVMAFVLRNKKNVPNVQTNKDKARYAQSIPINQINSHESHEIIPLTSSLHDLFLVQPCILEYTYRWFVNLSYSHMPLISTLYGNKEYDTYNFGYTNSMQLFNVDYVSFNKLQKEEYGNKFNFTKTNIKFSKSALSKLYDIEFINNKEAIPKILLYQKGHALRNRVRRIRNGIVGFSCFCGLGFSAFCLAGKFDTWWQKNILYSADIQKQYVTFPDKPTIYPIISLLAGSGCCILCLGAAFTAGLATIIKDGDREWKEKPLAVINIRSDQLCE
ncbi:MAG TPA: hypothetical protein VGW78_05865, partial [Candidatus Babeliales bacterium]|nr:hypothetical protein [Candidatus Babeliales bacterium]